DGSHAHRTPAQADRAGLRGLDLYGPEGGAPLCADRHYRWRDDGLARRARLPADPVHVADGHRRHVRRVGGADGRRRARGAGGDLVGATPVALARRDGRMRKAKIELQGISKRFKAHGQELTALERLDLAVAEEEFVALVGPSGCGKSTVLNMVAGLFPPSSGRIVYDAAPLSGMNHRAGYMTQKDLLLPWRTVNDNISVALELRAHSLEQ